MSISFENNNRSADPLYYEDNTCILPDSIFPDRDRAWVQIFVQDAKVNKETGKIKTCEFGLGLASAGWSIETMRKIVKILNKYAPIWLMADQNYLEYVKRSEGENVFANLLVKAMKENSDSNLLKPNYLNKILKKGPTAYSKEQKFNPDAISNYDAIGVCPYNVPSKNLRNINHPPILWLDNVSGSGPPLKTLSHKHLSRLMMNGTEAHEQNPSFLLIETRYKPELASFLKRRFPDDQKLMLKHPAASRGEGVIELDASDEKSLDKALAEHLSKKSSFLQKNPFSFCLIEKFISTPEKKDNELKETIFRFMYLVIKNNKEVKVHLVGGVKCFGKSSCNSSGIVKLSDHYNDGTIQVLKNDDLSKIRERISREIACVAKRAICYDPDKAVQYFLSSDSHILNLVGLELFAPHLTCSYREFVKPEYCPSYRYVTDQQCDLFLSLLKRNKSEIVRELILENIIVAEWEQMKEKSWFVPAAKLSSLLEQLIVDSPTKAFKLKCRKFLIQLYMDLFESMASSLEAKNFILKSLDLMQSEFPETFRNIHAHSWVNYFETFFHPDFEPSFNWSYPLSQEVFFKFKCPLYST